jgi:hypothetical protein
MTITRWLRDPSSRAQIPAFGLLAVALAWGLFRTARGLYIHSAPLSPTPTHDLYTYYSIWYVLGFRDCADIALRESMYLPHTWLAVTPLFILGWPTAQVLMFLLNTAAVLYIWWRLSQLTGLAGVRRWLLLAFFLGWSATGNVIGLGNLALICLAAVVAAYPLDSTRSGIFLLFAAMKPSLVFPLYLQLLFKRPRTLILPFATFAVSGLAALWWARLSFAEGLKLPQYWYDSSNSWTTMDHTALRRLLELFITNQSAVAVLKWVIWFPLFGLTARWIKDPLTQLAACLLLALLPTYHHFYDMVVAVPALAIFLQRCPLVWPTLMTFALSSTWIDGLARFIPDGPLRAAYVRVSDAQGPAIVLLILGGLWWLERRRQALPKPVEPQSDGVASGGAHVGKWKLSDQAKPS